MNLITSKMFWNRFKLFKNSKIKNYVNKKFTNEDRYYNEYEQTIGFLKSFNYMP